MRMIEEVTVDLDRLDLAQRRPVGYGMGERTGGTGMPGGIMARAPGIHLSGILRYILVSGRMKGWQNYIQEMDGDKVPLIWFLGVAWEEACASLYPDVWWQPGAVLWKDGGNGPGIWMTCDGLRGSTEYGAAVSVEEWKYTSAAPRTGEEFLRDWLKISQGMGYCLGYGTEWVRWHVCYNRDPWAPVYKRFTVEFDREELERFGRLLCANRQSAIDAGYAE